MQPKLSPRVQPSPITITLTPPFGRPIKKGLHTYLGVIHCQERATVYLLQCYLYNRHQLNGWKVSL